MKYQNIFNKASSLNQKKVTQNSLDILKMRYFVDKTDNTKETTFSELCQRVARVLASTDDFDNFEYKKNIEKSIYNDMMSQRFLFNSPCLFNAGLGIANNQKLSHLLYDIEPTEETYGLIKKNLSLNPNTLFACFVIDIPDSIDGIFDSARKAAIVTKYGGGIGAQWGNIREKGATIKDGSCGVATGPVSFMPVWNTMASTVVQGSNSRRAACMGMLYSNHPDIEEFIDAKTEEGVLSYFNISVAIDDKFMKAVKEDADYCLISPKDGAVIRTIKARDLYNKICSNAWKRGDPGIFFVGMANEDSLLKLNDDYKLESTNPCLTGDTLVTMSDGSKKRIDEIVAGDKVLTYNILTDKVEIEEVKFSDKTRENANIIQIELENGEIIKLTPDHKVYTKNRGYIKASQLKDTDELISL